MMCPTFCVLNFRKRLFTMLYKASKSLNYLKFKIGFEGADFVG